MTEGSKMTLLWTPREAAEIGPLDPCEFELVRLAILDALNRRGNCEIEQMVRWHGALPMRRRVQAHLEYTTGDNVAAIHVTVERDGEPIATWRSTPVQGSDETPIVEVVSAFTAAMLHAAAAKHQMKQRQLGEAAGSIEHMLASVHRAWQNVGSLGQKTVGLTSRCA